MLIQSMVCEYEMECILSIGTMFFAASGDAKINTDKKYATERPYQFASRNTMIQATRQTRYTATVAAPTKNKAKNSKNIFKL